MTSHWAHNRAAWNADAAPYQERNAEQIAGQMATGDITWGVWGIPESSLQLLGDVTGKDVLELGCGAAQWSVALARRGARCVGLDLSDVQLQLARANIGEARVRLVQGVGEQPPFADASFDIVFADYGAFTFGDPLHTIPGAARVLRPGGLLVFTTLAPLMIMTWPAGQEHPDDRLHSDYFGMHRIEWPDEPVEFNLPYGEWVRLFVENGFAIERLIETQPDVDARSTYRDATEKAWARRWPMEIVWQARKRA